MNTAIYIINNNCSTHLCMDVFRPLKSTAWFVLVTVCWCVCQEERILFPCSTLSTSTSLLPRPRWVTLPDSSHLIFVSAYMPIMTKSEHLLRYPILVRNCQFLSTIEFCNIIKLWEYMQSASGYFCTRNECSCIYCITSWYKLQQKSSVRETFSFFLKPSFLHIKPLGSGVWSWCCDSGPNVFFLQSPTTHWLPCCTGGAILLWGTRSL